MKVDGALKSLLQGVSQQPPRDRLPGQCSVQMNMSSDPVSGLSRRAPTDLVGALGDSAAVRGFHNFETRDGSKFLSYWKDGTVSVTDFNADPFTVTIEPTAVAYITTPGELVFGTIGNKVVVVNRSVVPAMTVGKRSFANAGAGSTPHGIIQVLGGQYSREYRINLNGTQIALYRPPDGSSSSHATYVRTSHIAQRLYECMTQAAGTSSPDTATSLQVKTNALASGYTVTLVDDLIQIKKSSAGTFNLSASDDAGLVNRKVMTDQVPETSDLPRFAAHRYNVRVATETDPDEDVFLEFVVNGMTPGTGVGTNFGQQGYWQESVSALVDYQINTATMPHILEYNPGTSTFTFKRGSWTNRLVGTDVSNPKPSFIGSPINDVTTFQNRLVFLAGSYVIMSRTNRHEDFWMQSAASLVESDPIDISSTAVEASTMLAAVPHNRDLVIFSPKGQFIVFGRSALTPANATLVLTTAFEAELSAKPVPSGRNVFFATNYGRFTGVREFYSEGSSDINDTRPITQHVKEYIVGKVAKLAASSNYDTMLVQTQSERTKVYVYQYIWNDTEKIQSSWSTWQFPHESVFMFFDEELIYFVMRDGVDHFLYRMSMDVYPEDNVGFPVFLDSKFDVAGVYTQFVLPYDRLKDNDLVVVQGLDCPNPGMLAPITSVTYDAINDWWVVTLANDMLGGDLVVGIRWNGGSRYDPTLPLVKDADGVVIGTANLRVKAFLISLYQSGYISGQLLSKYGNGEVVEFEGRITGDPDNVLGEVALSDEQFVMPFREKTDRAGLTLYTDSHLPMTILDIEWVGQYTKRGRRISTSGGE